MFQVRNQLFWFCNCCIFHRYLRSYFSKEYPFVHTNVSSEDSRKRHIRVISSPIKISKKRQTTLLSPNPSLLESLQSISSPTSHPIIAQPVTPVLFQALYHQIIQAHYQHLYQAQVHLNIQGNHLSTIPQGYHTQLLQLTLLVILYL